MKRKIERKTTLKQKQRLRLLGGVEKNEQMDTHETEEDREKKRKLEEGKEGKMTKPNDDTAYMRRYTLEAFKRSDEKMDSYSRKTDETHRELLKSPTKQWTTSQEKLMRCRKSLCWLLTQLGVV